MRHRHLLCCAVWGLIAAWSAAASAQTAAPEKSKYDTLTTGKKKLDFEGKAMWPMHHSDQQLLVEIPKAALGKEYIVITSIARGISSGSVIGGMSWGFGDDIIWTFKQSGEKLFVVQRNVRYRAKEGSPESKAVELAYSDSILYALPILTNSPSGNMLVDMTRIFMSDDMGIGPEIGSGFSFQSDRSTLAMVKPFENNVELEVAAVYAGRGSVETVPDARGVQVNVHYSIRELPKVGSNGYKPREADDRIGYFLTVIKDFSDKAEDEHFVRYINRWNLQKRDATADLSPAKDPIIFYVEKTVPVALRPTVEAGILEWNKAFEKIGFAGAIQVRHEEDVENQLGVDIDPEDVRFNFFRWITADAGFAMGPSRVDPRTGQILDADIIFDAGFLDYWKQDYETFTEEDAAKLHPNWTPLESGAASRNFGGAGKHVHSAACLYGHQMQQQMGFAAALLTARGDITADGKLPKEFVHQGLKEVVMHEVGHTLGLRHNFKASTWKSLGEIREKGANAGEPIVASVMDYSPANIEKSKEQQGLYYSQTLGPYDVWAIEYGYKPFASDEPKELATISARSGEPGHDYATDEDTRSIDSDPLTNRFDLGKEPIEFVRRQMEHSTQLLKNVVEKSVKEGQGYQKARQAFGMLMREYWRTAIYASRFPGGLYVSRDHKGDKDAAPPFVVVEADKQREAMKLLVDGAFASPAYDGPMLNFLAASRWNHWGQRDLERLDYPIHEITLRMQRQILGQLLDSATLERLHDNEIKIAADQDAYTLAEHLRMLVDGVFTEWQPKELAGEFTDRKPYIDSFRRNLQRDSLQRLSNLVTGGGDPEDARTLSRMHLQRLQAQITKLLAAKELKLDDYSKAHLQDCQARIKQVLTAELEISTGGSSGAFIIFGAEPR